MIEVSYNDDDLTIAINTGLGHIKDNALRFDTNVIIICIEGKMQINIDDKCCHIGKAQILACPSSQLITDPMVSPNFRCTLITMKDSLFKSIIHPFRIDWERMMYVHHNYVLDVGETILKYINGLGSAIDFITQECHLSVKKSIVFSLLHAMFLALGASIQQKQNDEEETTPASANAKNSVFSRFIERLNDESVKRHSVQYYAEQLNISPKHLSHICHAASGKSPKEWILEYVDQSIREQLRYSDMSIKEVAMRTGFPDMSAFGRHVRSRFGASPSIFRQTLQQ